MEIITGRDKSDGIKVGRYVELKGLVNTAYLNGRVGIVVGEPNSGDNNNGRYAVNLLQPWKDPQTGEMKDHQLSLKGSNLRRIVGEEGWQPCPACKRSFMASKLMKCSGCKMISYCSPECQRKHWKEAHKADCALLKSARKAKDDTTRLPEDPGDRIFARMNRGVRYMQRGDATAAEKEFRAIIDEEDCHMVGHYHNLASTLIMQGRIDEALEMDRRAVSCPIVAPEDKAGTIEAYFQMAGILKSKKDNEGAKQAYHEVLKRDPRNAEAKLKLSQLD